MAKILVVDDNWSLLDALHKYLKSLGHSVTVTNNGADALCILGLSPSPDVVILDMNMPGVDGHAVLSRLGAAAPPVVIMSGEPVGMENATMPSVSRVLQKPFPTEDLLSAIGTALRGKKASPDTQPPA